MSKLSKSDQTREKILKVGWSLFQKKGFEQSSMRDIAQTAGVATGAAYYYFKKKEDLVLELYKRIQKECEKQTEQVVAKTKSFEKRFYDVIQLNLKQLNPYRKLMLVLAENSMNFKNSISPFSIENTEIRTSAIENIHKIIKGSNIKVHPSLLNLLPTVLWLYEMAIVLLWTYDSSTHQKKTQHFLKLSLKLICILLKISLLPIPGKKGILQMVQSITSMATDIIQRGYKKS